MRRLHIDFNNQNGLEMIISGNPPLTSSELQHFELRMLTENDISRLLPFTYTTINEEVQFFYRVNRLKMLDQLIKRKSFSQQEFYSSIASLLDALISCHTYMLSPEACLLDSRYIFVNEQSGQLNIAYLPIASRESLQSQLLRLLIKWSAAVTDLDVHKYQMLLKEVAQDDFQLLAFQQKIYECLLQQSKLVGNVGNLHQTENEEQLEEAEGPAFSIPMKLKAKSDIDEMKNPIKVDMEAENSYKTRFEYTNPLVSENKEQLEDWEDDTKSIRRLELKDGLIFTIIMLGAVAAWIQLYVPSPTSINLWLCVGISLICVAICLLLTNKRLKLVSFHQSDEEQDWFAVDTTKLPSRTSLDDVKLPWIHNKSEIEHVNNNKSSMETVKLDADSYTVNLMQAEQKPIVLIRQFRDTETEIELTDDCFIIGRSNEGVHFYEEASGVSRLHLQLENTSQGLKLKDIGSRNGSYINGKLMVPYKEYTFTGYDYVQLVNDQGPKYRLQYTK